MDPEIKEKIKEQYKRLPLVVQNAITDASIEKHLRILSNKHRLHLDQWQVLENEVLMTLMGIQPTDELEEHIKNEVGVDEDVARELANDISLEVFDPIRKEMERQLEHPDAQDKEAEPIEDMRSEILAKANANPTFVEPNEDVLDSDDIPNRKLIQNESISQTDSTSLSKPESVEQPKLTPDPQPKIKRSPISGEYVPGIISTERKDIKDDPYRESPELD
jgi:hypothetical protein